MSKNKSLAIVILAAGMGTRMKSSQPKIMHRLAGLPMVNWLLRSCKALNPEKIIVVVGPDMKALEDACAPHETVVQADRNGTGGAVKSALPALEGFDGQVLILMGDEPLIGLDTLQEMAAHDGLAALAFDTDAPEGLGRVVLNADKTLKKIVEDKDCSAEQKAISLCNAGTYSVPADKLSGWVEKIGNDNAQGEYYLTDLPMIAAKDGVKTDVIYTKWRGPWGVNDKAQLAAHEKMAQDLMRASHMREGVTMIDPDTVYFHHDTKVASDIVIEPNVFFGADVVVESGVTIKANSHIEGTKIGEGAIIGPFARLRPDTDIGAGRKGREFCRSQKIKDWRRGKD